MLASGFVAGNEAQGDSTRPVGPATGSSRNSPDMAAASAGPVVGEAVSSVAFLPPTAANGPVNGEQQQQQQAVVLMPNQGTPGIPTAFPWGLPAATATGMPMVVRPLFLVSSMSGQSIANRPVASMATVPVCVPLSPAHAKAGVPTYSMPITVPLSPVHGTQPTAVFTRFPMPLLPGASPLPDSNSETSRFFAMQVPMSPGIPVSASVNVTQQDALPTQLSRVPSEGWYNAGGASAASLSTHPHHTSLASPSSSSSAAAAAATVGAFGTDPTVASTASQTLAACYRSASQSSSGSTTCGMGVAELSDEAGQGPGQVSHGAVGGSSQSEAVERTQGRFPCPYPNCKKSYTKKSHLKVHIRVHTGERPYKCDFEGCNKSYARSDELKRHICSHTGEKPYACPMCDQRFVRSDHLAKHTRRHTEAPRVPAWRREVQKLYSMMGSAAPAPLLRNAIEALPLVSSHIQQQQSSAAANLFSMEGVALSTVPVRHNPNQLPLAAIQHVAAAGNPPRPDVFAAGTFSGDDGVSKESDSP